MKRFALAVILGLIINGCAAFGLAGRESREYALIPGIEQAWTGVSANVERGIEAADVAGEMLAGQDAATELARVADWNAVVADDPSVEDVFHLWVRDWQSGKFEYYARYGVADRVADGEIGFGVSQSFLERIDQLDDAFNALVGEPTEPDSQ